MEIFTVAFFGHRYISNPFSIEEALEERLRRLLREKEYVDFLIGRNGDFDQLVSSTVRRLKRTYRDDNSNLCLVLPYATAEYLKNQEFFEDYYDSIEICHESSIAHPKAAIQTRNRAMIDRADLVICYINHKSGGAYQSILYAVKQQKEIQNISRGDR